MAEVKSFTVGPTYLVIEHALEKLLDELKAMPAGANPQWVDAEDLAATEADKQMLIEEISRFIPVSAQYTDARQGDKRNYQVAFDHLRRAIGERRFRTVGDGIAELICEIKRGGFDADDQAYRSDYLNC